MLPAFPARVLFASVQVYCTLVFMTHAVTWPSGWAKVKSAYDWPPLLAMMELRSMYALSNFVSTSWSMEVRMAAETSAAVS